jgi:hypothetical protein
MGTPESIFAINLVKRIIVEGARLALRVEFIPGLFLIALKTKKRRIATMEALVQAYNEICYKVVSPFILKPEYMIPCPAEVRSILTSFMCNIGVGKGTAKRFGAIFSHIIEYDNAYRFRLLDLMSETTKEKLAERPIRELRRLALLSKDRDAKSVTWKFQKIAYIICIGLLVPSIRRAFKKSILESDFEKLQYDEVDRYWTAMRSDYKWWGQEADERAKFNIGKSIPAPVPKAEYERLMSLKK